VKIRGILSRSMKKLRLKKLNKEIKKKIKLKKIIEKEKRKENKNLNIKRKFVDTI